MRPRSKVGRRKDDFVVALGETMNLRFAAFNDDGDIGVVKIAPKLQNGEIAGKAKAQSDSGIGDANVRWVAAVDATDDLDAWVRG